MAIQTGYWYCESGTGNGSTFATLLARKNKNQEDLTIHSGQSYDEEIKRSSFTTIKKYADDNYIPLYVFWSDPTCGICDGIRNKVFSKPEFKNFVASGAGKNYLYYITDSSKRESGSDSRKVWEFVKENGEYPQARAYWKKSSGEIVSKYCGRGTSNYYKTSKEFTDFLESTFSAYAPPTKYKVTFNANGGEGSCPEMEVIGGQKVTLPDSARFQRSGYSQSGWMIGSTSYAFGAQVTVDGNITVLATWDEVVPPAHPPSVDDPIFEAPGWTFSNKMKVVGVKKEKFPISHQYSSNGYKRIQFSNNISSMNAHGIIENTGLENQIVSAYLAAGIPEIDERCFYNCTNLLGINADNSIRKVNSYAFYNCHSLQGINFLGDANKELRVIGSHAFDGCGFRSIKINHLGSVSDSSLDDWCFANNKELTAVQFINSTYLGAHMFDGCEKLVNVQLNNYHSYVGAYAFANCRSLQKLTLPPKIYMISEHMFDGCTNLTEVVFEDGAELKQIGNYAFANCPKLTSITLPASVNDISYLDPEWLAGSSISRVTFKGLPDEVFADTYEVVKNLTYQTNYWYSSEEDIRNVYNEANSNNIPIVVVTGLPFCSNCKSVLKYETYVQGNYDKKHEIIAINDQSIRFDADGTFNNSTIGDYLNPKNCFWLFGIAAGYTVKDGWICTSSTVSTVESLFNVKWSAPTIVFYWKKEDGSVFKKDFQNSSRIGTSKWLSELKSFLDSYSGSVTETHITIKSSITTFGRGALVTFVSSNGNEYVCTNNTITKLPTYRVDHRVADNFKFHIWYYNARQLKQFADSNHLPVLVEWGAKSCDPCRDFMKNTFRNHKFQEEISKRNCLLCKVELGDTGSFASPTTTQEYFVSHEWGQYNMLIPQLIFYWKKSSTQTYKELWNYNYRSDPANANYEVVLQKLDTMLGSYAGNSAYLPPQIYQDGSGKYRYYAPEGMTTSGFTVESGKYIKADGTLATTAVEGFAAITMTVDPTQRYFLYTACASSYGIHVYDASGNVLGGKTNASGTIIGSVYVEGSFSTSHDYHVFTVNLPSNARTIKATNMYQTGDSALPFKYRSSYDVDGRYFICDSKTEVTAYTGTIDVDMSIQQTGNIDEDSGIACASGISLFSASIAGINIGKVVDLQNNWYQQYDTINGSPSDKSGVIFKVYDAKVEAILTFTNTEEQTDIDYDGLKYKTSVWHQINDQTPTTSFDEIRSQCQKNSLPLVILEDTYAESAFETNIKNSTYFTNWMKTAEYVFVNAKPQNWTSNAPKAIRDFEAEIGFEGNVTTLPKILVYHGCSTCNPDGSLEVFAKKTIAYSSTMTVQQYCSQIDMFAKL